jgi:hypothetical protein
MSAFYLLVSIQFASVLCLGLPVAAALTASNKARQSLGWFLLAPAMGATVYFCFGTILHSFGLRSAGVFWTLLGLSGTVSIFWLWSGKQPSLRVLLCGIGICFAGAGLAFAANTADLAFAGLDYFPLTNDDTFAYLGYIDQIRSTGWIEPRISYPAGFSPIIGHAVFIRAPSTIFVADFADILNLETHSAFFMSQRLALPIIALGAAGVVMLVTLSSAAAALCFAALIFGNALLHQILQQFNSSTMGTVIAPLIIAVAIWTIRPERSENETLAGYALSGWACGTMALTSIEAHPFYLMVFCLVTAYPVVIGRHWQRAFKGVGAFTVLYFASSFTFVTKVWPAIVSQLVNTAHGHPGDWIATSGFLMQATGVTFTAADKLSAYPLVPRIVALSVVAVVVIAVFVLAWTAIGRRAHDAPLKSDLVALFSIIVLVSILQIFLYALGAGYALLKVTDYFAFVGAVVVSVAAFQLGLTRRRNVGRALVGLVAIYCMTAFFEKERILENYRGRTARMPLPFAYQLSLKAAAETVYPDLSAEPLNLFLYENRYGRIRIVFNASESYRFLPLDRTHLAEPIQIARIFRPGIPGLALADITYPPETTAPVLEMASLTGQTHLVQPDSHWLLPEGDTVDSLWRWVSISGRYLIYGPLAQNERILQVDLAPGPDLRSDNQIEFYISGQRILSLSPSELPRHVAIPLPSLSQAETQGEIRIVGQANGIRQLFVSKLLSVPK